MNNLHEVFAAVAPICFTLVGLLFIAYAGDDGLRRFWLFDSGRSLFAYLSLLSLIIPGTCALIGLIPVPAGWVPAWPVGMVFFGLFNLLIAALIQWINRGARHAGEFLRLRQLGLSITRETTVNGVSLLLVGGLGWSAYYSRAAERLALVEALAGLVLVAMLFAGVLTIAYIQRKYQRIVGMANAADESAAPQPVTVAAAAVAAGDSAPAIWPGLVVMGVVSVLVGLVWGRRR